ncbi:DNA-binding protein [Frankliniella fusca]|uniref:DNA-binding protein n=1 Tax=Frankliniella fusca TaxID=407009 RepID=A0AAE1HCV3_9NEOP|nr:DNA-binding protein [Frankliniella fusca]
MILALAKITCALVLSGTGLYFYNKKLELEAARDAKIRVVVVPPKRDGACHICVEWQSEISIRIAPKPETKGDVSCLQG